MVQAYESRDEPLNQIMRYIASTHPVVGFMLLAESLSASKMMETFKSAESQGKGVRTKYEYWNGNTSQSVYKIKNKSVTIE